MAAQEEQTLGMVKPDAVARWDSIEKDILEAGFKILYRKRHHLEREQAEEFYAEHKEKPFFNDLVDYMTSGDVIAFVLSRANAILEWRKLLGPTKVSLAIEEAPDSLRAKYGDPSNDSHNAAHGSDSSESAKREIRFFFPHLSLGPLLGGDDASEYLNKEISPTLVEGLSELCKVKPEDPVVWLADWLIKNNPNANDEN